jgi:wyosine [tRNA(Phe)-imidazoG37] synthetase (radical SAM superfamily)
MKTSKETRPGTESDAAAAGTEANYVFGPVPSRRLGKSLGIDPIPFKTCNWNCVYCQLGRTAPLTTERKAYVPADKLVEQVKRAVERHRPGEIDWITFVGSGEPTLHVDLGRMIREVKAFTSIPVAVITNGSLLFLPEVREELTAADAVLPSVDAGSEPLYQKINRPAPQLKFAEFIEGLCAFRQMYGGKFWVEVMLVKGLNDTEEALADLATVLRRIGPAEVHLNLPVRPPADPWVEPPDEGGLMRATAMLGAAARILHPAGGDFDLGEFDDVVDAVVTVVTRHPMRRDELIDTLHRWESDRVDQALKQLRESGQLQVIMRYGQEFWSCAGARYVEPRREMPAIHIGCK